MSLSPGSSAIGVVAGAVAWSFTEYATHRWVLHGPFGRGRLSRIPIGGIHRNHHRDPEHTVPMARAGACLAMLGVGAGAGRLLRQAAPGLGSALTMTAGLTWGLGYSVYDVVHHRLHHRPPTTPVGVRMRQRHVRHHFGTPAGNLGVTSGLWDRLLGTEIPETTLRVPRTVAPSWLDRLGPDFTTAAPARSHG